MRETKPSSVASDESRSKSSSHLGYSSKVRLFFCVVPTVVTRRDLREPAGLFCVELREL